MEAMRTRTVTPIHSGRFTLARVVALIGSLVAAVIVIGILLGCSTRAPARTSSSG